MQGSNAPPITPEWIAEHNARVAEFWAPIRRDIDKLPRKLLREIARLVRQDYLTMSQVAQRMRDKMPFTWEAQYDVAVGMALYKRALNVLNLYDDDFRVKCRDDTL